MAKIESFEDAVFRAEIGETVRYVAKDSKARDKAYVEAMRLVKERGNESQGGTYYGSLFGLTLKTRNGRITFFSASGFPWDDGDNTFFEDGVEKPDEVSTWVDTHLSYVDMSGTRMEL